MIRMNEETGRMLYERCREYMNMERGMDYWDFVETVGISPGCLDGYFQGRLDLPDDHYIRLARVCHLHEEGFRAGLIQNYQKSEEEKRKQRAVMAEARKRDEERARRAEEKARLMVLKAKILDELREYGITRLDEESRDFPLDDYRPLKFVMHYLWREDKLPLLEALVKTAGDGELVHGGTNALMWAAGTNLAYDKLMMLADRKDFIAAHIRDRGPAGITALHLAAEKSSPSPVRLLIEWGADVNAKDDYLWTPLHCAATNNGGWNERVWDELRKAGAVETENARGDTPARIEARLDAIDA